MKYILVFLLILLSLSCDNGDSNPYSPVVEDKPTVPIWDLQTGASWKYTTFFYTSRYDSYQNRYATKQFGKLSINVKYRLSEECLIEKIFTLDSLYQYSHTSSPVYHVTWDTTYTIYAGDPNLESQAFSQHIEQYLLVQRKDTLLYKSGDSLRYVLMNDFTDESSVNLNLFQYPVKLRDGFHELNYIYNMTFFSGNSNLWQFAYESNFYPLTISKAQFDKSDGGLDYLYFKDFYNGMSGYDCQTQYDLIEYIPGERK